MLKSFLTRQALKYQLKDLPEGQREMVIQLFEKNPDLFKKIGEEIEAKTKAGQDKTMASIMVMKKYERELRKAAGQ